HWKLYDETARQWRGQQANPFRLPNLHFSRTANQSRAINRIHSGAMVIAGSGMCSGGRILHHFKHHLWRRETEVLITGFQARGTPGRALVDGAQEIKVWGEPIRVGAKVHTIGGLSAHADSNGLVEWYGHFRGRPPVALVHGEAEQRDALAERLAGEYGAPVLTPGLGERMDLADPDRLLPAG
ncbi:MAG: MBL fold metallo-hydrolase RNA specificity domain-containing protein, partial [Thiohalospira sp.]